MDTRGLCVLPPGANGYPPAEARCLTCRHRFRFLIEDLLDARTPPPVIVAILRDHQIWSPGKDSIRTHRDRHRAAPAAERRARQAIEFLASEADAAAGLERLAMEFLATHPQDPANAQPVPAATTAGDRRMPT